MQDIFDAIERQDVGRLERLLSGGADPDQIEDDPILKRRPLHAAVVAISEGGPLALVYSLLAHGADIDATSMGVVGGSPLLCALFEGEPGIARTLLEAGADPNVQGAENASPLRWAVKSGDHEMAALLLAKGADRTIDDAGCWEGSTALGMAVFRLDVEMVKLLLRFGANPHALDVDFETAADQFPTPIPAREGARQAIMAMLSERS